MGHVPCLVGAQSLADQQVRRTHGVWDAVLLLRRFKLCVVLESFREYAQAEYAKNTFMGIMAQQADSTPGHTVPFKLHPSHWPQVTEVSLDDGHLYLQPEQSEKDAASAFTATRPATSDCRQCRASWN